MEITPATGIVMTGRWQTFNVFVSGMNDPSVTWSIEEPGGGSIDPRGNYLAPSKTGTFHVVATSHLYPGTTARAEVQVVPLPAPAGSGACPDTAQPAGMCNGPYCWDYPAPFGMDLMAAAAAGEDLWAGGRSFLLQRKGSSWTRFPAPGTITRLWADQGPDVDLFALIDGGGIFRFDGTSWTASLPGAVDGMAVVSRSEAYAIERNTILGWDGQAWTERFRASSLLRSTWAKASGDVLAVGGLIAVHLQGGKWTEAAHGLTMDVPQGPYGGYYTTESVSLERVLGVTGGEFWVQGFYGGRGANDGSGWTLLEGRCQGCGGSLGLFSPAPGDTWVANDFIAAGGPDASDYWFSHYRGHSLDRTVEVNRRIEAIAAGGPYAVGASGSVWKLEADNWTKQTGGAAGAVESLWVDDCGRGLAFLARDYGQGALALRKDGNGGWTRDEGDPDTESFSAASYDDAWASGFSSLWHRDRAGWSRAVSLPGEVAVGLSSIAADDVWAIGNSVWHFDGSQWTERPLPGTGGAVWGRASDDAWALRREAFPTQSHALWHWDGNGWSLVEPPAGVALKALSGDDEGALVAGFDASARAVLFRPSGNGWVGSPVPDEAPMYGVSISRLRSGEFVLLLEHQNGSGAVFRWDGVAFTPITAPLDSPRITAVQEDGSGRLWVGTGDGIFQAVR